MKWKGYKMAESAYLQSQKTAMNLIDAWVKEKNTPMPKGELFKGLVIADISESTARKAIASLVNKGYLRRFKIHGDNRSYYGMLRSWQGEMD